MTGTSDRSIILIVSTGWGVRTFLQTELLSHLLERVKIVVLTSRDLMLPLKEHLQNRVDVELLHPFNHQVGKYGRIYQRRNAYFQVLSRTGTRQAKRHRAIQRERWQSSIKHNLLTLEAKLLASPDRLHELAKCEREVFHHEQVELDKYYETVYQRHHPSIILSTVPHMADEAPPILSARRLGIESAAWINSWDNLTSKPAYFAYYDYYFLWSEQMRCELLRYYPESRGRKIAATGVPHFDWYHSPQMVLSREEFCQQQGLDPHRPILLYGMATPHLAPREELIVKQLAHDLDRIEPAARPQLVIRLHPGDGGRRLQGYTFNSNVRLQMPGERGKGQLSGYCPTLDENREFVSTVANADVVINLASTLTLDAAICNRPIVNVAFAPTQDRLHQLQIDQYYFKYDHYRTVLDVNAIRLARSHEELLAHIQVYLKNPEMEQEGRRKLVELWCGNNDGLSARRLADSLFSILGAKCD